MANSNVKSILYYHLVDTTFLIKDEEILKSYFKVHSVFFHRTTGLKFIWKNILATFKMIWLLPRLDIFFTWFADYHALIPVILFKMLGKKSFIVIGGYDAAKNQQLGYGAHLSPFRSKVIRYICQQTQCIIPVSEFSQNDLFKNIGIDLGAKSKIVYNGIDQAEFYYNHSRKRENLAVMIAGDKDDNVFKRKSADLFVEVAKALPEYRFLLIGMNRQNSNLRATDNLEILPWQKPHVIREKMGSAKVVCQWSRYEAFGIVLIEGMMCGCTPVCHAFGGTKEIIDPSIGYITPDLSIDSLCMTLCKAFQNPVEPQKVREYAMKRFSLEKREKELIELIDEKLYHRDPPTSPSEDTQGSH